MKLLRSIRPLFLCLSLLAPLTARGDATLLAEFGLSSPEPVTSGYYNFAVGAFYHTPGERSHSWTINNGTASQVLYADAVLLEFFSDVLAGGAYPVIFLANGTHCGDISECFGVQYEILVDGPEHNGWFGTRHAPSRGPGLTGYRITDIERSLGASSQSIRIFGALAPIGDYNQDGSVDAADYVVWRKVIRNQTAYNTWRANYGDSGAATAGGLAAPEPGSILLVFLALPFIGKRPPSRRSSS